MFEINFKYTKNDIYDLLKVPLPRRKGAWNTGYREYEGDIYIFSNVGIPGRTGHDYNNYWDGDFFEWEAKNRSNKNQSLIKKMLNPELNQKIFLFTRTNDKEPFTFEGTVKVKKFTDSIPLKISWELLENDFTIDLKQNALLHEGAVRSVIINKYERNPLARRMSIEYYGAFCNVCGLDFFKSYGDIGKGFIHVHHIVPLSKIQKEYILDPIKDLIPICPNCHSMIHRTKEPLSIEDLRKILAIHES